MDASLHSEFALFFLDLSTEERERIMSGNDPLWARRSFETGAVIFEEDSPSNELYLVLEGDVEVSKKVGEAGARKKVLAVLGRGSIFGEGALLSDQPRSATATALKPLDVLVLSKDRFKSYVKEDPVRANFLVLGLVRVINQRLIWTNEELVTLYDIAQMVGESRRDMAALVRRVCEKLAAVTRADRGGILLTNALTGHLELKAGFGGFVLPEGTVDRVEPKEGRLLVLIADLSGRSHGVLVLEQTDEWRVEQTKMAQTVAEQLGVALADTEAFQAEQGRTQLKRESVQF